MWHNNVFFNPTSDLWCHLFCRMTWKQINAPEKMKENQPAKQDPPLEAIFKWMYVVIVYVRQIELLHCHVPNTILLYEYFIFHRNRKVCFIKLDVSKVLQNWHRYFPNIFFDDKEKRKENDEVAMSYVMLPIY